MKNTIPDEFVEASDTLQDLEDVLESEQPPVTDVRSVAEPEAPAEEDIGRGSAPGQIGGPDVILPNRPLRAGEIIYQRGNVAVQNQAEPPAYIRLYDRRGHSRLVLRELAGFALTLRNANGERVLFLRPPVAPKQPQFACPVPECGKRLATRADRENHIRGYHPSWYHEYSERRRRRQENRQRRSQDLQTQILAKLAGVSVIDDESSQEDLEDLTAPDPSWDRRKLLSWLRSATGKWEQAWLQLSTAQAYDLAMEVWLQRSQPESAEDDIFDDEELEETFAVSTEE